jgi:redox-sensing transcriptional repressor
MSPRSTRTARAAYGKTVSEVVVVRLIRYRTILRELAIQGTRYVFSHELAAEADVTPEQLRRDLMGIRYEGSPSRGYEVVGLEERLGSFLDPPARQGVALAGVGNLGRALFAYFLGRRPLIEIVAAFDIEPAKINRVVSGCPSYHISEASRVVPALGINVAIIAVPAAAAQAVADVLVDAGVRSFLNFADMPLRVSPDVFVEHIDIGVSLEKVAFFARRAPAQGTQGTP